MGNNLADFWNRRWLKIRNTENRTIPPHAALEIKDVQFNAANGEVVYLVKRPTRGSMNRVLFNSHEEVSPAAAANELDEGAGTMDYPCEALLSNFSPEVGQLYGTIANSYFLKQGNRGFEFIGQPGDCPLVIREMCCPEGSTSTASSSPSVNPTQTTTATATATTASATATTTTASSGEGGCLEGYCIAQWDADTEGWDITDTGPYGHCGPANVTVCGGCGEPPQDGSFDGQRMQLDCSTGDWNEIL